MSGPTPDDPPREDAGNAANDAGNAANEAGNAANESGNESDDGANHAANDSARERAPGREVAAGEGRTRLVDQVALRLGILRGLSEFLERQTRPDGVLWCPRHRVEHTGKNVYGALINLENWRFTREDFYLERARRQVLRTVDMLGLDPESKVPVFLPGRVDPRNASTNSIDGGACADVIATLLEEAPDAFRGSERERASDALERHVEGYLRHSARDKPIPAQRLWAGTGVARAARLLDRPDWAADALAGCALALSELAPDGVAPYIPPGSRDCTHPGLSDTSTFYHSRTPGFVLYIHEILGVPLDERGRERVRAALDALVAMRDGNFRKVLANEAKPWYWESAYEVASHPFDAWALQRGARAFPEREALYRNEAGRAMEEWIAHLGPDGGAQSHHGKGINFQCRIFWSAHAAWIARVIEDVPLQGSPRPPLTLDLPDSGLVHVERPRAIAVLRGRHRRSGNLFGCDAGGGQLQSLVVPADRRVASGAELVPRVRFVRDREGSFLLRPRGAPGRLARLRSVLSADRGDCRFRLFVTAVEWRARRPLHALAYPWRHIVARSWREASPWLASHLDLQTEQHVQGDEIRFDGALADRDGLRWPGTATERRYAFLPDRVALHDTLRLSGVTGRVRYRLPAALSGVEVACDGAPVRRRKGVVTVVAQGGQVALTIRGHWLT